MSLLQYKHIVVLGIVAFLVMSFWSLFSMSFDMNGQMVNCPFMNGLSSFCQMSVSEHINQWQQFFKIIKGGAPLLYVFALLFIVLLSIYKKTNDALQRHRHYFYRYKPEIKLFDNLALAFSDGLIHPKIYA